MRNVLPALASGLLLLATACGDNGGGGTGANGTGAEGTGGNGTGAGSGTCPGNLAEAPNSEFCDAIGTTPDFGHLGSAVKHHGCGVPIATPEHELRRSPPVQ